MFYLLSFYLVMLSGVYFMLSCLFLFYKINILMSWLLVKIMGFKFEFILYFDWITFMFFCVVSLITAMVLLYSLGYMLNCKFLSRFMILILIFFISMKFMIISPNMFSILLGWDGLGVSSYCLIVFYQNKKSLNSGFVTILMNRVGDIGILIMVGFLFSNNFLNYLFLWDLNWIYTSFILLAAMTKSAQIPFSSWLPLAMAAPTPVSALVHSSTLVTAGVYLLIRFSYVLNGYIMLMLMVISCLTMFSSSISAMFEFDLKKIIALSTLSQLGLMMMSISVGMKDLAFFHLITHAMFKSLLFLCSGIIIHNYFNNQDIRFISIIYINMPLVGLIFSVASLSLCGMPFLSGFYSKDLMIEFYSMGNINMLIYNMMYMSMMNTVIYSIRLILYVCIKPLFISNCVKFNSLNIMNYSLYLLFILTLFYGSIINWLLFSSLNFIFLIYYDKLLIYWLVMMGCLASFLGFFSVFRISVKFYSFMNYLWLFQILWKKNKISLFTMGNWMISLQDLGWIENLSGKWLSFYVIKASKLENFSKLNFSMIMILISYLFIISLIM